MFAREVITKIKQQAQRVTRFRGNEIPIEEFVVEAWRSDETEWQVSVIWKKHAAQVTSGLGDTLQAACTELVSNLDAMLLDKGN